MYFDIVWKTLAMMKGTEQALLNVEFENVQFHGDTILQPDFNFELTVMIHYGNGSFEVSDSSNSIVTGVVRVLDDTRELLTEPFPIDISEYQTLNQEDFYKEMRLRGYNNKDEFQSVVTVRSDGITGTVRWNNNWVLFMQAMLQTIVLKEITRSLLLPLRIQKVRILPKKHFQQSQELRMKNADFKTFFDQDMNILHAGGIDFIGIELKAVSRQNQKVNLVLESYKFLQYKPTNVISQQEAYRICIQLLMENTPNVIHFNIVEVDSHSGGQLVVSFLHDLFTEIPLVTANLCLQTNKDVKLPNVNSENVNILSLTNTHLIILNDSCVDSSKLEAYKNSLLDEGFIIVRKQLKTQPIDWSTSGFNVIAELLTDTEFIVLLRLRPTLTTNHLVINISNANEFDWIKKVKKYAHNSSLLLVSQHNKFSGIIGLVNCIRREPEIKSVTCLFIDDTNAPAFDSTHPLYAEQLSLNLAINVYQHVRYPFPLFNITFQL